MATKDVIIRFDKVSFHYQQNKPLLEEVDFIVRRGTKITLMGQNGAGKSTIFKMITGELRPEEGDIHISPSVTIATAKQVIPPADMNLTVRAFFEKCFDKKIYDIDPRIDKALAVVNMKVPDHDKKISEFSGGQQARLLLASALIQNPDVLLLDEPTNNLDKAGIEHLTEYLKEYKKTCVVISHDAEFLNAFTQGVLYLDVFKHKIEMYAGNYTDVVKDISARIERENRKNAQLEKEIQERKEKANFFAKKGGKMRDVAKKMKDKIEELEEEVVDVRAEDKTIRKFEIPCQQELVGELIHISEYSIMKDHKVIKKKANISLGRNQHLLLSGPNGIGKSTLLEALATGKAKGATLAEGVRVGYYRQDFSTLDPNETVREALSRVMALPVEEQIRATAGQFLILGDLIRAKIGTLSEGQKGLVAFAQLVLMKPGILFLDEPTNHINFRHIPIIATALSKYQGAMILVSHVPEFVKQIRIDEILDLDK